jgi:hypothetical protein
MPTHPTLTPLPPATAAPSTAGRRRAALTLALLSPLVAEVTLGTTPLSMIWLVLFYVPMYGAGALLIRELARRRGIGWGGVLLLGVCYALVEEGLALQSLTSPHLYGAAHWAPRVLGVNTAYAEVQIVYHAVFSVTIPVLLTELIHPRLGRQPYLRRFGLVTTAVVAVLGTGLVRLLIPPFADPGYQQPPVAIAVIVVLVAVLAWVALGLLPRRRPDTGKDDVRAVAGHALAPTPRVVGACSFAATFVVLALLFPFGGARQSAFTHGAWAAVPMALSAAIAVGALAAGRRWGRAADVSAWHAFGAAAGALVAHTGFALLAMVTEQRTSDAIGLGVVGLLMCLLLAILQRTLPSS